MQDGNAEKQPWSPLKLGCVTLVLIAVLAPAAWVWRDAQRGWTKEKLERLIAAEVPAGCERAGVEAWGKKHGIHFSGVASKFDGSPVVDGTMAARAGLRIEDVKSMISGDINGPAANVGFLEHGRIHIYFFFDKEGRYVGHAVEERVFPLVF